MNLDAVPYLIISRELDFGFSTERVFLCICLIDHMCLGVGLSRDEALRCMVAELEEKHGNDDPDPGFETGAENWKGR